MTRGYPGIDACEQMAIQDAIEFFELQYERTPTEEELMDYFDDINQRMIED